MNINNYDIKVISTVSLNYYRIFILNYSSPPISTIAHSSFVHVFREVITVQRRFPNMNWFFSTDCNFFIRSLLLDLYSTSPQ